ncbi:phosphatase PAP2 family protein [Stenotrophomonas sp.]|uniref:phosphatase PAP2 family protein n=1 Tax=Stenotrophomonas sp. TaxID=69392 RepID=UPI003341C27D
MHPLWVTLSQLGDSRWLLPLSLVLIVFGPAESRALRLRWAVGLAVAGGLTLASKLAFLGWGIGWARLDFTGFSGHATMTAAVYPVALYLATHGRLRHPMLWALLGSILAAAIAYSRLPLNAHSVSEVVSGWLLGTAASAFALSSHRGKWRTPLPILATSLAIGIALPLLMPTVRTHDIVMRIATGLSGREQVFNRHHFVR